MNILVRLARPLHPHNPITEQALNILRNRGEILYIASQNLGEFRAVATRPLTENGLEPGIEQVAKEIESLKCLFVLLPRAPASKRMGKAVHDIPGLWEKHARCSVSRCHVGAWSRQSLDLQST